jgi:hypothetical protein
MQGVLDAGQKAVWSVQKRVRAFGGKEFSDQGHGTVALLAGIIGAGFGIGLILFFLSENFVDFGAYLAFLCFFHWSEYILVALYRNDTLSADCKLTHSSNNHNDAN